jgi:general secretion pathway protein A
MSRDPAASASPPSALYAAYFGLRRDPFSIAPDPRLLFMSERHREALAHLLFGVKGGGGFVLLTGEIGAGKTTVCRCLLEQLPANVDVAYILNPRQSARELLQSICEEFRLSVPDAPGDGTKPLVDVLNRYLLESYAAGRSSVLIVDEAQSLSIDVLEQLRLLTNLETHERKLLQIILIGQPELRQMLDKPELEQLAQRVIARYHLRALSRQETGDYVRHRLAVAGVGSQQLFDTRVLDLVFDISRGVPRRINLLCDRALLGAYARSRPVVDDAVVERAAQEVFDVVPPSVLRRRLAARRWQDGILIGSGLLLGLSVLALVMWLLWGPQGWMKPESGQQARVSSAPPASPDAASAAASAAAVSASPSASAGR